MYKVVVKLAWISGSLSLAGVIMILFLQGMDKNEGRGAIKTRRSSIQFKGSRPIVIKGSNVIAREVVAQPRPTADPELITPGEENLKLEEAFKPLIISDPPIVSKEKNKKPEIKSAPETKPKIKPKVTDREPAKKSELPPEINNTQSTGRLFAESELNQLIGKIQAEKIRFNSNTNCIQIRITADNKNAQAVSQVERFLTSRDYIITGREKEDFLRGRGLKVYARGGCFKVTIGTK